MKKIAMMAMLVVNVGFTGLSASAVTFGEVKSRVAELQSYITTNLGNPGMAVTRQIASASQELSQLALITLQLRTEHLKNDLPEDPDNSYYSRRRFDRELSAAKTAEDLFALNERLVSETLSLFTLTAPGLLQSKIACQNALIGLQGEVFVAAGKLSAAEQNRFAALVADATNRRNQLASALSVMAIPQPTVSVGGIASSGAARRVSASQGYCSIHQCSFTRGIGMGGGCPKCNTAQYGLGHRATCPRCHQTYDPTYGHPNCR